MGHPTFQYSFFEVHNPTYCQVEDKAMRMLFEAGNAYEMALSTFETLKIEIICT
jgi:hypothetical protein